MKNKLLVTAFIIPCLASGCTMSNIRQSLGASKNTPDEFMVETRPNLVIPEKFDLPKPHEAGMPDFDKNNDAAKAILIGTSSANQSPITAADKALLTKANATQSSDSIKKVVYEEHKEDAGKGVFGVKKGGFLEKVLDPFGYNAPKDPEIDVEAERKRIQKAIKEGKPVTGDVATKSE